MLPFACLCVIDYIYSRYSDPGAQLKTVLATALLGGPALIGFVAQANSLPATFAAAVDLLVRIGLFARIVQR